jgi:hypothetical protein
MPNNMEQNNHLYNLMTQLTQEMRSLWRIERHYLSESESDAERMIWEKMKSEKISQIDVLKDLVKETLNK